jgi:hypothetical protein
LVDLSASCIEACRQRFADSPHVRYLVNDGTSLAGVADDSIDLAFRFDSLVRAEQDVLAGYLSVLATKLKPGRHSGAPSLEPWPIRLLQGTARDQAPAWQLLFRWPGGVGFGDGRR